MPNNSNRSIQLLGWYVRNCAVSSMAGKLEGALLRQLDKMQSSVENDEIDFDEDEDEGGRLSPRTRRRRLRALHQFLKLFATAPSDGDNAERNVGFACGEFNLDRIDREILLLLVRYDRVNGLEEFADKVFKALHSASRAVAALTGIDPREVHARVASNGTLVGGGLIIVEIDDDTTLGGSDAEDGQVDTQLA